MRLLNSTTLQFKVFSDENLPPYAILSHTWGSDEISFQGLKYLQTIATLPEHLRENEVYVAALAAAAGLHHSVVGTTVLRDRAGYAKLDMTAKLAKANRLIWFWIDTCCIDKSSSAELQEAINSMYRWYQNSTMCFVYLEDVDSASHDPARQITFQDLLASSRWITRGWTLQELIAPSVVHFYDSQWGFIAEKESSLSAIRLVTGIPEYVLDTGDLSRSSVAQKMAWAAGRVTTRIEDMAYSLLGIFQVHMPMLYGERENAFMRLQEEIIRTTSDDSIFAWTASEGSLSTYRGLLARSPHEFRDSHLMSYGAGTFANSNLGLRIEIHLRRFTDETGDDDLYLGLLNGLWGGKSMVAIILRQLGTNTFARVCCDRVEYVGDPSQDTFHSIDDYSIPGDEEPTAIYVEHKIRIPRHFKSRAIHAFCFRRGESSQPAIPSYRVGAMRPIELASFRPAVILIPRTSAQRQHDFEVSPNRNIFHACVKLSHDDIRRQFPPIEMLLGYNLSTGVAWCRILGANRWPGMLDTASSWRFHIGCHPVAEGGETEALISTGVPGVPKIKLDMVPGLDGDKICLLVYIDGLTGGLLRRHKQRRQS